MNLPFPENPTGQQVLWAAIVFMGGVWALGKLKGTPPSEGELIGIAAIIVVYAIIDHLHAIRRALEDKRP